MVKTEYCTKMVEKRIDTVIWLFCDKCGKLIKKEYGKEYKKYEYSDYKDNAEYFKVTTGHHDWGNDSCESIDHRVYCRECLSVAFAEYLERCGDFDTEYMEIEHSCSRSLPLEEG